MNELNRVMKNLFPKSRSIESKFSLLISRVYSYDSQVFFRRYSELCFYEFYGDN